MNTMLTALLWAGWAAAHPVADARSLIRNWQEPSKSVALDLLKTYGEPDAADERMLVWRSRAPWFRVAVVRDPAVHQHPAPHFDVLEMTVRYTVPQGRHDDIVRFDPGLVVDATRGLITAHCDSQARNTLLLNLAHDVARGQRSPAAAREFLRRAERLQASGKTVGYATALRFPVEAER